MSSADAQPTAYDTVPYTSWPYPQSHPDRLATMAAIFGLATQPIEHARVLELGCASGGNLIPMAIPFPESRFLGVDLSARQAAEGQAAVEALGLKNIEIRRENILDINDDLGKFHYVIVHGIYSWVPENVREKILSICSRNLEPNGVAYVSYNTYPGWRMRQMLRDMLIYHTERYSEPKDKISHARALLGFFAQKSPAKDNAFGAFLKEEAETFAKCEDQYLLHDHLEEVNEPVYFHQFMRQAQRHELQYVGEACLSVMFTSNFPPDVEATLRWLAKDLIQMEQYMDFLRNRQFRQTLLCHASHSLTRALDPAHVRGLQVGSPLREQPLAGDAAAQGPWDFRSTKVGMRTSDPLVRAVLQVAAEAWPRWMPFDALMTAGLHRTGVAAVQDAAHYDAAAETLARQLLGCFAREAIELHSAAPAFITEVTRCPVADPLARHQAEKGPMVTNRRHERVTLNDLSRRLIRLLDGTRDEEALVQELMGLVDSRALVVHREGAALSDGVQARPVLELAMRDALRVMARTALLIA